MKKKQCPLSAVKSCPLFVGAMAVLILLAALSALLPPRESSEMENRTLAQLSPPTLSAVLSGAWMEQAEDALADQFPARDRLIQLNLLRETVLLRKEHQDVLHCGQRLLAACETLNGRQALRAAEALSEIQAALDVPVTLLLVPLPSRLYPDSLPAGYVPADQAALTASFCEAAENVAVLDCYEPMAAHADRESLFYRTDHHWTAAGARCAYEQLAAAWGFTPAAADSQLYAADFYGSTYARAPLPFIEPDALCFAQYDEVSYFVNGEAKEGLYDKAALAGRDKYAALLYGNPARATLVSSRAGAKGTLLVLKDSYANALLPALGAHYARIEIVDPRYYSGDLRALLEETEAEQILCVYGMNTLLTDRSLSLLAAGL